MKLATLRNGKRDGQLAVVNRALTQMRLAEFPTLQAALDDWGAAAPLLQLQFDALEKDPGTGTPFRVQDCLAPLPRAYEWVDGSAYLNHVRLVRKARNAEPPPTLETDPLVYQGGSGHFLSATEDIPLHDESWGCDFESEVCVVLGDVPQRPSREEALAAIKLLGICNDVSLRNLIPAELAKGFGFFQSKPATALGPVFCTPDELGPAWKDGRIHLRLHTWLNGKEVGSTDAGPEMHFSFVDLIQHIAKTRDYTAGSLLGSGTVSNADRARGISCLAEQRMIETIEQGGPKTPFLKAGDRVEIEMFLPNGQSAFGRIHQKVVPA